MKTAAELNFQEPRDEELFVRLFSSSERKIRSFVFGLVMGEDAVDEIMQEVSLVLWRKFNQFDPGTEFLKWAYVVARYEVLMFRRRRAREKLVFDDSLLERLADEHAEEAEALEQERQALRVCMTLLRETDRKLLLTAYAHGKKLHQVAKDAGRTPTSIYKKLNRLRQALLQCIEKRIASTA